MPSHCNNGEYKISLYDKGPIEMDTDAFEILCCDNHQHEFPNHYHETYCITLVEQGLFSENEVIAPAGSIVVSHPFEVHNNKPVDNMDYSFSTIYIEEDLMRHLSHTRHTSFEGKVVTDMTLFHQLQSCVSAFRAGKDENLQDALHGTISLLITQYGHSELFEPLEQTNSMDEVKHFILGRLDEKIELDALAGLMGMDKYKFIRWFKKLSGLTPFEYI